MPPWPQVPLKPRARKRLTEEGADQPRSWEWQGWSEVARVALAVEATVGMQQQELKAETHWRGQCKCSTIILCHSFTAGLFPQPIRMI